MREPHELRTRFRDQRVHRLGSIEEALPGRSGHRLRKRRRPRAAVEGVVAVPERAPARQVSGEHGSDRKRAAHAPGASTHRACQNDTVPGDFDRSDARTGHSSRGAAEPACPARDRRCSGGGSVRRVHQGLTDARGRSPGGGVRSRQRAFRADHGGSGSSRLKGRGERSDQGHSDLRCLTALGGAVARAEQCTFIARAGAKVSPRSGNCSLDNQSIKNGKEVCTHEGKTISETTFRAGRPEGPGWYTDYNNQKLEVRWKGEVVEGRRRSSTRPARSSAR